MTPEEIEICFREGRDASETAECPYHPATLAAHWWTRGRAYSARMGRYHELRGAVSNLIDWCDKNPPAGDALFCVQKLRELVTP